MSITIKECFYKDKKFKGLYEIEPEIYKDNRGEFCEIFSEKEFKKNGLDLSFVQDNQSFSKKNVLRGLHFQKKNPQGKLVYTVSGKVFDVVVDLRNESETFGKYFTLILDSEKHNQLYIPKGFAHGFYALTENTIFAYKCSDFYNPNGEDGIIWNDKTIGISWSEILLEKNPILNEKDKCNSCFNPHKKYFNIDGIWIGD